MSTPQVTSGAVLKCSFGSVPSVFIVQPVNRVTAGGLPTGTILDNVPITNVPAFVMCSSPSNPDVIAETAAAEGVFTPAACIPVITAPWTPGTPTVTVGGIPALDCGCKLLCAWAGEIAVEQAAQMTVKVP